MNSYFQFKQFLVNQEQCAMKVTTDACLFGAWAANKIAKLDIPSRQILEIGTGTGLLSLMLAQSTEGNIVGIEIDQQAYEQAKENIKSSPWAERIKLIHGDAGNYNFQVCYDVVISNPPFYENELKAANKQKNIAHHDEGMLLPQLLDLISDTLSTSGRFYIMFPAKRKTELQKILAEKEMEIQTIATIRQSVNHGLFRVFFEGSLKSTHCREIVHEEIIIRNETGSYSPEFTELLKPYYLNL